MSGTINTKHSMRLRGLCRIFEVQIIEKRSKRKIKVKPILWDLANISPCNQMWSQIFVRLFCPLSTFYTLSLRTHTVLLLPSLSLSFTHIICIITCTCMHSTSHHHHPSFLKHGFMKREKVRYWCACNIVSFFCTKREKGLTNNRETESSKNRICYALVLSSHLYLSFFHLFAFHFSITQWPWVKRKPVWYCRNNQKRKRNKINVSVTN